MTILIIDDEPLVRKSLSRLLQAHGHSIFEANDGRSGLNLWREKKPDLVFLDVLMPGMNGPEVLSKIGTEKGKTKVVMISAYTGEFNRESSQKLGADLFIPKPFEDIFSIVKMVEELMK